MGVGDQTVFTVLQYVVHFTGAQVIPLTRKLEVDLLRFLTTIRQLFLESKHHFLLCTSRTHGNPRIVLNWDTEVRYPTAHTFLSTGLLHYHTRYRERGLVWMCKNQTVGGTELSPPHRVVVGCFHASARNHSVHLHDDGAGLEDRAQRGGTTTKIKHKIYYSNIKSKTRDTHRQQQKIFCFSHTTQWWK